MTSRHRWIVAFRHRRFLGFLPPALTGATLSALGASDAMLIVGLALPGAIDGLVLGAW